MMYVLGGAMPSKPFSEKTSACSCKAGIPLPGTDYESLLKRLLELEDRVSSLELSEQVARRQNNRSQR